MDGWLHPWFMIIHHINLAGCRQRGKPMEEVEERNEACGCHEDQEFLSVIIVHVDFLFTVNHANDVDLMWIWWSQSLCRRVIWIQWSLDYDDTKTWLELAAGGWPVGQDMRILTSRNQVIGMGGYSALMVMVSEWYCIHTSIHHHISVHCPAMTCCHCSLALEDNCNVLLKHTCPIH